MLPPSWPRRIEGRVKMRVEVLLAKTRRFLAHGWSCLREVCEDNAYDRYRVPAGRNRSQPKLTAAEFYLQRLERKYSRPSRCC